MRLGRGRSGGAAAEGYRRAARPAGATPWRDARFCVVDLETTGLDPRRDEVVAWAAVPVSGGRIAAADAREGLARPERGLPASAVLVHGLRAADLAAAPTQAAAGDALLEVLAGRVLVAHAAWVERGFLAALLGERGARLRGPALDTEALGRLWLSGRGGEVPRTLPLARLARELGLPAHRPHTAAGDALTTAQAFLALATHLERRGGRETVRSLDRAPERLAYAGR